MKKQLRLPVGIENFEEIRTNNYYYVDKTKLIEQVSELPHLNTTCYRYGF